MLYTRPSLQMVTIVSTSSSVSTRVLSTDCSSHISFCGKRTTILLMGGVNCGEVGVSIGFTPTPPGQRRGVAPGLFVERAAWLPGMQHHAYTVAQAPGRALIWGR